MRTYLLSIFVVAAFAGLNAGTLQAQEQCPEPMAPTIEALRQCVIHARDIGHIDNQGIANSLLSKLAAAQAGEDRGQLQVATSILEAFINEVEAQKGKHIDAVHAQHMIMHASDVIAALGG